MRQEPYRKQIIAWHSRGGILLRLLLFLMVTTMAAGCTSSQTSRLTTPTVIAETENKEWDYVIMGDSTIRELAYRYVGFLEQDLGVKVTVHDWTEDGQHSSSLLSDLKTNESLRQDIRGAEVITFDIPVTLFSPSMYKYLYGKSSACGKC